jgi:L,D-peptidoglycan transpeptidase YkuD (ErfK/YbiS/YcfS/YnhG family)
VSLARVLPEGRLVLERVGVFRCALGKGGVRPAREKREGDGATPAGLLPLRRVLWRADRGPKPRCAVPVAPIAPKDGWCDDPGHADYNRPVRLPHPARHEELWRSDGLYDIVGVLGWNDGVGGEPIVPGRGSAIFLHLARPDYAPTEGCVALAERDLRAVLAAGLTGLEVAEPD